MDDDCPMTAFPSSYARPENRGMELRDYFAAHAMIAVTTGRADEWGVTKSDAQDIAEYAYCLADAMLEARKV